MSYLARPRVAFWGVDAMTNPSTANNENVIHLLDYNNVRLLNPPQVKGARLPEMSDAAYREWMTTLITYADPPGPPDPTQPDWQPGMPGYWNYWGDHLTTFGSAKTSSVWLDTRPVTDPAADPLLGASVVFNARIVDLDPADTFCSQFVAAYMSLIGPDRNGEPAELLRGVPTTSMTRWLNFYRYLGAGTFQAVLPKATLSFVDPGLAPDSAGFRALRDGAAAGGGLLVRWCFYGMQAAQQMPEMYDRFQKGEKALNPKVGSVVGSIGVWNGTDLISTPVGRMLAQPGPPFFAPQSSAPGSSRGAAPMRVKTHEDVERIARPGSTLHALSVSTSCDAKMGPAAALVEGDQVVLDLSTAFPEIGCVPGTPGDPYAKHDFGEVRLEVVNGGSTTVLGPVRYDLDTYRTLGGVWAVDLGQAPGEPIAGLAEGWLQLRAQDGTLLLREAEVPLVVTDDQAVYLDLDKLDGALQASGSVALRVFEKGEPLATPTELTVEVWADNQELGTVNSVNPLVITATMVTDIRVPGVAKLTVPAGGRAEVEIRGTAAGCYKLRYIAPGMHVDEQNPNFSVEYYSCYRILPWEDYSTLPDSELTFELVYQEVFSYYSILYPVMSRIIPWGPSNTPHDPERVSQFASLIADAIDESRRGTTLEMPITRELSAGKRALLQRWCQRQLRP